MATKQCHTCKHNGKKSKACLTCNTNVATRRDAVSIDANPALADKLICENTESPVARNDDAQEIADFFREWLFLPPRARDIFAALYINGFVMAAAAKELHIGPRQIAEVRKHLEKHAYFGKFFPPPPDKVLAEPSEPTPGGEIERKK